jgi:ubiquinol-cytochrome c reductase cytochrome b subunit/menaquinol-cytochrome c reductase cytochrome b/c subunit
MASIDERRAGFQRYKDDVKRRGKPFFPTAMFHDTVMSFVVVVVIIVLACLWRWTAEDDLTPDGKGDYTGWLGSVLTQKADPGTTSFVPRPDWYFYFLFYLLRIFKWPDSVILGTVGIPTILLVLLLAIPFVDTRLERRLLRRPVAIVTAILVVISMGVLTYKGATAKESLASELEGLVPVWAQKQGFADNPKAVAGAKLFTQAGCTTCHTYLGAGSSNLGAPDLSAEGSKGKGVAFQVSHLECPSCVNPGSPMPSFKQLTQTDPQALQKLAVFLEASKGETGGGGTPWGEIIALIALGLAVLLVLALAAARRGPPRYA